MEEKRKDVWAPPASTTSGEGHSFETPVNPRRRGGGLKRKQSSLNGGYSYTPPTSSKRQAREKQEAPIHNYPVTRARVQPSSSSSAAAAAAAASPSEVRIEESDVAVKGADKIEEVKGEQELNETAKVDLEDLEASIEAAIESIRTRNANVHVVPNHAGWFSWNKVHSLEEKSLPSFFDGKFESRTPDMYLEIRNWIMKKFHANPNIRIELNDLTEIEAGDMEARQVVMEFLEYWGLINYHPFPKSDSTIAGDAGEEPIADDAAEKPIAGDVSEKPVGEATMVGDAGEATIVGDANEATNVGDAGEATNVGGAGEETNVGDAGEAKIPVDASEAENGDSLLKCLFHFESEDSCMPVIPRNSVSKPAVPSGLFPESTITEDLVKSEGPSVEYHCNSCSADCSRKRYHCQKQADYDLCPECFNNGMFDSDMSPSDFILMEPAEAGGASSGKWTDQETLLLLEALELFNENWNEIAEHVATKTKAQCILHFVQMPIEDAFFDNGKETESASKEHVDTAITDDKTAPKAATEVIGELKDPDGSEPSSIKKLKPEEVDDSHISKESENLVMKALNEAFEDVGLLSSSDGHLSFAEAANPVMTLAAFLVKLVDPNVATISVRNSLKLLSSSSSGEQLALRNCFCLEDPPEEEKSILPARIDTEMAERETQKEEDENIEQQKSDMDVDSLCASNDETKNVNKDPPKEEAKASLSCPENVEPVDQTDKASSDTNACKMPEPEKSKAEPETSKEPDNADNPSKKGSVVSDNSTMEVEVPPGFEREPVDSAILAKPSESTDVPVTSLKNKDPLPTNTSNSTDENAANKEPEDENGKLKTDIDGEDRINKIRNAAVATISALSVKAKLFANKEEEQIRQLAALLIDRQMNKLEMKLSYLSEMENLVMRVREQVERSKMRLFQERALIIAARMSGQPRPGPMHPGSRSVGLGGGGNSGQPRPPSFIGMSGGGQRPLLVSSRPNIMMSSNPNYQQQQQQQKHDQQQLSSSVSQSALS